MDMLKQLQLLLRRLWDICLLRRGPQDLPASGSVLLFTLLLEYLLSVILHSIVLPDVPALRLASILLVLNVGVIVTIALLLILFQYRNRILQSLTALAGTSLIFNIVIFPFALLASLEPGRPTLGGSLVLMIQIWSLVVSGHIFTQAMSINRFLGVTIAFCFLVAADYLFRVMLG